LLAKAGGVDLAQAAEISAVAMNSFGLAAGNLSHVADEVAAAANASSIGVDDFRQSLSQVGAVARTTGVSFDDTAVAIAELGQAGIKGSDAGTSLRTFLLRLTPESKQAEEAMRSLGIITADGGNKFFDASGRAKTLAEISEVLKNSLNGYTDQQKIATLQTIFGTDAIRAASVFAREGATGFDTLAASMAKISAQDVATQRLKSFSGEVEILAARTERLKLALGAGFVQQATPVVQGAGGLVDQLAKGQELQNRGFSIRDEGFRDIAQRLGFDTGPSAAQVAKDSQQEAVNRALVSQQLVEASIDVQSQTQAATQAINAQLKPARDLRAELDLLGQSAKGGASGINLLEAATAGLKLAGEGDLEAVAALRAEAALRLREQAVGERNQSSQFRQRLIIETTDQGISPQDRAKAAERLSFFDQETAAQLKLAQIEQQRATADQAVQREQDLQRQATLAFQASQLPLEDAQLHNKVASILLDQQAAPLRSQILSIEQQITQVTDQRLALERERNILLERQRSAGSRGALEENQTRIRELQLELQSRDPSIDRSGARREIRDLQRQQPGIELEVLRSDRTIRGIQQSQESTKIADDLRVNGLNQQKLAIQAQLTPLEQRKRLIDDASQAVQRQLDIEKAQFDQGQLGSRQRLLRAQQITGALGLSADAQQEVIASLGLPQAAQGPQPIAGQAQGNNPISVTIQNMGDMNVRTEADLQAILDGQKAEAAVIVAGIIERAAASAPAPASVDLNGARRPIGQPQG
jgi:TP901 family phage tail tape measure protein